MADLPWAAYPARSTMILVTIDAQDCKCQDLDLADEHLECAACGMNYHSDAEYLEAGDPCPACHPVHSSASVALVEVTEKEGPPGVSPGRPAPTCDPPAAWRAEQYPTSGRWRRRKQVVRQLAADIGWPGCMDVAHDDLIVGAVLQAGVRLRDWRRFERSRMNRRGLAHRSDDV